MFLVSSSECTSKFATYINDSTFVSNRPSEIGVQGESLHHLPLNQFELIDATIECTLGFSCPAQTRNATLFISRDSYISLVYGHLYQWPENLRLIFTVLRFSFVSCVCNTERVSCSLPCSHIRTTQGGRGDLADRTNMTPDRIHRVYAGRYELV